MSKGEIAVQGPPGGELAVPEFMLQNQQEGLDLVSGFIKPARVKIVQKQSGSQFLDKFNVGDAIIMPQAICIAEILKDGKGKGTKDGTPFFVTPVFFYPEWCKWNPIELKGSEPAIVERTTDSRHPLAAKARNPQLWREQHPTAKNAQGEPLFRRNQEHLNFVCIPVGHPMLGDTMIVLSFARGSHRVGTNFCSLIKMRKAPIYGCQYQVQAHFRGDNPKGEFFAFDVTNPSEESGVTPFVADQLRFETLAQVHRELKKAHEDGMIDVDYEDDDLVVDHAADAEM